MLGKLVICDIWSYCSVKAKESFSKCKLMCDWQRVTKTSNSKDSLTRKRNSVRRLWIKSSLLLKESNEKLSSSAASMKNSILRYRSSAQMIPALSQPLWNHSQRYCRQVSTWRCWAMLANFWCTSQITYLLRQTYSPIQRARGCSENKTWHMIYAIAIHLIKR